MSNTPIKDLALQRVAELRQGKEYRHWINSVFIVGSGLFLAGAGGSILALKVVTTSLSKQGGHQPFLDPSFLWGLLFLLSLFVIFVGFFMLFEGLKMHRSDIPSRTNEPVEKWLIGRLNQLPDCAEHAKAAFSEIAQALQNGKTLTLSDAVAIEAKHIEAPTLAGDIREFVEAHAPAAHEKSVQS